jgi:L-alanine-DL-glutamate epimerase-like enolase superfamily enzyme
VDLAARLQNVPAAFILGGQFVDKVPVIAPWEYPPDEMAREASGKRGFTGGSSRSVLNPLDVERIRAVREAVGLNVIMRLTRTPPTIPDALRTYVRSIASISSLSSSLCQAGI